MAFQGDVAGLTREDLVQMTIGRAVEQAPQKAGQVTGDVGVSLRDLSVAGLHVETFDAARGEVVGIAGAIGSAQTKLLQGALPAPGARTVPAPRLASVRRLPDLLGGRLWLAFISSRTTERATPCSLRFRWKRTSPPPPCR